MNCDLNDRNSKEVVILSLLVSYNTMLILRSCVWEYRCCYIIYCILSKTHRNQRYNSIKLYVLNLVLRDE